MLPRTLWFIGGVAVGVAVMARLKPANESSCCKRVAGAVRGKVGDTFGSVGASAFDWLGLSDHAPAIIDAFGVPYDD